MTILENKLGITNQIELAKAEEKYRFIILGKEMTRAS